VSDNEDFTLVGCLGRVLATLAVVLMLWFFSSYLETRDWVRDLQRRIAVLEQKK